MDGIARLDGEVSIVRERSTKDVSLRILDSCEETNHALIFLRNFDPDELAVVCRCCINMPISVELEEQARNFDSKLTSFPAEWSLVLVCSVWIVAVTAASSVVFEFC